MSLLGSEQPRLHTPLLDLPSRGLELVEFSAAVGFPLLPYQQWLAVESHRVRPDGRWAARTLGAIVARQNGKSAFMRQLILWSMFEGGISRVISMAQNRALALDQFKQAIEVIEANAHLSAQVKRVNRTNGQEALVLNSGQQWQIVAATMEGPRGRTADLLWIDELREINEPTWKAATPLTRARMNARTWVTSNAGDNHSSVLNGLRAQALQTVEPSVFWAEWSADPKLAPDNPEAWRQANPALGHLIDEDVIRQAQATDKPAAFETESLSRWVDSIESPWPYGKWDECADTGLVVGPGLPTWFGFDITPDRRRADLVAAQLQTDGKIAVGLVQSWHSDNAVDDRIITGDVAGWARKYSAQVVAFDKWTGASVAQRLGTVGIPTVDVSGVSFAQACDLTLSNMVAGRIVHAAQPELNAAMAACAKKPMADGGWRIVRRGATVPISAAVSLIMCVAAASEPQGEVLISAG